MIIFDNSCEKTIGLENDFYSLLNMVEANDHNVTALDIRGGLSAEQFISLFAALKKNNNVAELFLRGEIYKCDLSNEKIYLGLSNLLQTNKNIKALTLYHTDIQDDAIESLTNALGKNNTLNYLKICGHNIGISGELSLIKMLEQNTILNKLVLDYPKMSEPARLVLLSQHDYFAPINLDISNGYYLTFCNSLQYEDTTEKSFLWKDGERDNPIGFAIKQKELEINKLVKLLEHKNFSQDFIKITKDFCYNNSLTAGRELAEQYAFLEQEYQKISMYHYDTDKINDVKKYYENAKRKLLKNYNDMQLATHDSFAEIEKAISSLDKEVKQRKTEPLPQKEQMLPVALTKPEDHIYEEKDVKIAVAKKLDINDELQGTEYISHWAKQVIEMEYDIIVFSIGGTNQISQQIPAFSNGLGRVAILNIDNCFSNDDMENISSSNNISVNYLRAKIQNGDRFSLLTPAQKQQYKIDSTTIRQEELADNIYNLISSGKKVILLSHISINAPREVFEKVLKNQDIMNNYGDKFLFIHSYFKDLPTILCSKKFVDEMMSPNMSTRYVQNKSIYTREAMPKGEELKDLVVADRILGLHKAMDSIYSDINEPLNTSEGVVCRNLDMVSAHDVMPLLGIHEDAQFMDSDIWHS